MKQKMLFCKAGPLLASSKQKALKMSVWEIGFDERRCVEVPQERVLWLAKVLDR
jgi:hypothetical protein